MNAVLDQLDPDNVVDVVGGGGGVPAGTVSSPWATAQRTVDQRIERMRRRRRRSRTNRGVADETFDQLPSWTGIASSARTVPSIALMRSNRGLVLGVQRGETHRGPDRPRGDTGIARLDAAGEADGLDRVEDFGPTHENVGWIGRWISPPVR